VSGAEFAFQDLLNLEDVAEAGPHPTFEEEELSLETPLQQEKTERLRDAYENGGDPTIPTKRPGAKDHFRYEGSSSEPSDIPPWPRPHAQACSSQMPDMRGDEVEEDRGRLVGPRGGDFGPGCEVDL
jgi:hypothetical protein